MSNILFFYCFILHLNTHFFKSNILNVALSLVTKKRNNPEVLSLGKGLQ